MPTAPSKSPHSDRSPIYLSPAQRAEYEELAKGYRYSATTKTGPAAADAYDNSAVYYERIRDHTTARQMRHFAGLLRSGGQQAATIYEGEATQLDCSGRHPLAQKLRNFAKRVRRQVGEQGERHIPTYNLNSSVTASIIGIGLFMGVSLLYSGFTGNAISNTNDDATGWIGLLILLIAIGFGAFHLFRKKRKK